MRFKKNRYIHIPVLLFVDAPMDIEMNYAVVPNTIRLQMRPKCLESAWAHNIQTDIPTTIFPDCAEYLVQGTSHETICMILCTVWPSDYKQYSNDRRR